MRILIGMSGGVDSTYAAWLLRQAGHTVEGVWLRMHGQGDWKEAQTAAEQVGIPLHVIDCETSFMESVQIPFARAYAAGRTPNPCVLCNPAVKFAQLESLALAQGFDRIATGHYCGISRSEENGRYFIRRAGDRHKDQSYVLWGLTQRQLSLLLFPLEGMHKEDLRRAAKECGFFAAESKDSQEICFLPHGGYADFVEKICGPLPEGDFVDESGRVVGRHHGIACYTVGQRKGLGLSMGRPVFVTEIDAENNTVTVADADSPAANQTLLYARFPAFQKFSPPSSGEKVQIRAEVRVRYAAQPVSARVTLTDTEIYARLDQPVRAVTPGQSAVFYEGDSLLFGGEIRACREAKNPEFFPA